MVASCTCVGCDNCDCSGCMNDRTCENTVSEEGEQFCTSCESNW